MQNWQEWRKEIREDRRESPVETFALLLVLAFGVVLVASVVGLMVFYFPIPMISIATVVFVLWKVYQRL